MAHHLFRDIAVVERKVNDTFYGNEKTQPVEVKCSKQAKFKLVKTANNTEVQSKMLYLFPADFDISPTDIIDGSEVLIVQICRGLSFAYKEVLT